MQDDTYRIPEKFKALPLQNQSLLLASESSSTILNSSLAIRIVSTISAGPITRQNLIAQYIQTDSLALIMNTLAQLECSGFVTSGKTFLSPEEAAFWQELGYQLPRLEAILASRPLSMQVLGHAPALAFLQACQTGGLHISDQEATLHIVLAQDYLNPELEEINVRMQKNRQAWLLVRLNSSQPLIGPLFLPQSTESACYRCLAQRLRLHDQECAFYQNVTQTSQPLPRPLVAHPLSVQVAALAAVQEIIHWLYHGKHSSLDNGIMRIDAKTGQRDTHTLVKRPQCPVCGNAKLTSLPPLPIHLNAQSRIPGEAGGYRTVAAEETLRRYQRHVSPITGIVPYLNEYHHAEGVPIYNFESGTNLALQSTSMFWLNMHLRSSNGGKGKTAIQAKVGALCESIERYSMMHHGQSNFTQAKYQDLEDALHPNDCMLFSDTQMANREEVNANAARFYALVPVPFADGEVMDWTPVYSLTEQKFKYLPACFCYAQYPAEDESRLFSYPDSNGCAAGNTLEEAILQGFLELVERDAAAIWWYNLIQRPEVDLQSAGNPYIDQMVKHYAEIGRSLYVLDLTTDLGIPVFASISHQMDGNEEDRILYAFGAHLEAGIALERAIIEMNQLLPITKIKKISDPAMKDWLETVRMDEQAYLRPSSAKKNILKDYPELCPPTIYDSIQYCIQAAEAVGLETLVLDLTQPDIGMPVAKVIVPGLRHMWRRTAPGRLYDVPVKMGWLDRPYKEEELNPISIFI